MNPEIEQQLEDVSAADLLRALQEGEVDIDDLLGAEKTAGLDLSDVSDEELVAALDEIDELSTEKVASSEEAEYWDAAGRIMARGDSDELSKQAGVNMDLNELSPEEIVGLAYDLVGGMEKEASEGIDLNDLDVDEFLELAAYLEDDMEKEAASRGAYIRDYMMKAMKGPMGPGSHLNRLKAYGRHLHGGKSRKLVGKYRSRHNVSQYAKHGKKGKQMSKTKAYLQALMGRGGAPAEATSAVRKSLAARGAAAAGAAGIGAGAYYGLRDKKKKR